MSTPHGAVVGVLAVQGAVSEHANMLEQLGVTAVSVRKPEHLEGIDGLIIPGGESTAIARLAAPFGLLTEIRRRIETESLPVLGTCAGLILLARELTEEGALAGFERVSVLDVVVSRNAYGNQLDSFEAALELDDYSIRQSPHQGSTVSPVVAFIRAPKIVDVAPHVQVLARHNGEPVAVAAGRVIGATFHPEITGDLWLHSFFVQEFLGGPVH